MKGGAWYTDDRVEMLKVLNGGARTPRLLEVLCGAYWLRTLRALIREGLVEYAAGGYRLTDTGRTCASTIRGVRGEKR